MNTIKQRILVIAGLFFASLSISAHSAVYQWTDNNGVNHFTQRPPTDRQYKVVTPNPVKPEDAEKAQRQLDALIEKQKASQEAREAKQRENAEKEAERKKRQQQCNQARERLANLQNRPRLRITEQDGTVRRASEEERQERISQASNSIDELCSD
ncbi:hypothetical protein Tel_17180 (plasmid) [Candidatus Tenderia electrophaga]|jgi:sRNA-binding protein|uniref:DUF4124 domain-containing protein n=1 Tax=Candidatus Tenderia electrophaga TaxID=1748243 RepID=A0A0S2TIK9_9GAMM|nr:hypothetical protein Tel_17180 [Candidatus Tenderia electrophaga]